MNLDANDQGHKYWMNEFQKGRSRQEIYNYFKQTAKKRTKNYLKYL